MSDIVDARFAAYRTAIDELQAEIERLTALNAELLAALWAALPGLSDARLRGVVHTALAKVEGQ